MRARPVSGNDADAKAVVMELANDMGSDAVDAGGLDDSWRQQPGTAVLAAPGTPLSRATDFDAAGGRRGLAQATPERKPEWRATARGPGTFQEAA